MHQLSCDSFLHTYISLWQMQNKWAGLGLLHELTAEQLLKMRLCILSPDRKIEQLCASFE